ncbi:unnamed protein product, partial [Ectocarpus sp. 12 AP-2014]
MHVGYSPSPVVMEKGLSWPFEEAMDMDGFRAYFLSHAAFVDDERDAGVKVWGAFYIKPNFPGRCSHVCNGGFITDPRRRRRGVARLMGHAFLRFAKDLGYRASYFNLVFRSNEASLRLWRGLGFTELAVVPKAARLK